ncbi:MAG: RimK family protein, partial [Planctomycetota bacterium JB042]
MNPLVVVSAPSDWPLSLDGVDVVTADEYLTHPPDPESARRPVVNLCRSLAYQRSGYYVSLLAEARGHRPIPEVGTLQDLRAQDVVRLAASELAPLIERSLARIATSPFELSVYFGRNLAKRHDPLSQALFRRFRAPLMRATFARPTGDAPFALESLRVLGIGDVPESHREFVAEAADQYLRSPPRRSHVRLAGRFQLAILHDPEEAEPPSDERALARFTKAAGKVGLNVELIRRSDYGRLAEFDALFLRITTSVRNDAFRFSRKAAAEGLVVIDDPQSILRCTNKVYLAEALARHKVPAPRTVIVHRGNADTVVPELGLPCVLKQPDSAFSAGVVKVETAEEYRAEIGKLLDRSALVIAQEFLPTDFDWRIGVLDKTPLYACRYFMAKRHWQIIRRDSSGRLEADGASETIPVELAPTKVVKAAVRAANLMGDGLYGVDLKQLGDDVRVIEVNDTPSLDSG